jgi:hypothetical protein
MYIAAAEWSAVAWQPTQKTVFVLLTFIQQDYSGRMTMLNYVTSLLLVASFTDGSKKAVEARWQSLTHQAKYRVECRRILMDVISARLFTIICIYTPGSASQHVLYTLDKMAQWVT